jgi:hypothetical protein
MAIQSNSSEVQVTGGGIPLYTGIAPVRVVAVNPNLGELASVGVNLKNEPTYDVSMGDKTGKIVFWIHNEQFNFSTRFDILVGNQHRAESSTGKFQITNKYGQVTWATDPDSAPDWFKKEGVRRMYPGEETLINFIKAWANIPNEGECSFDTIDDIVKGNVEELKSLVTALKDNKLRVLLGVKDAKYQSVYTRHFGRLKPQRDQLFVRALNDSYGEFNAEYNDDLKLQPYAEEVVAPTPEAATPEPSTDIWS